MAKREDENPAITARRAAINLLARREHSFVELQQKLTRKLPDFDLDEVILPALEKLRDENLQSDERFVESYVRYRYSRGVGPLKIGAELSQKGVKNNLVRQALYEDDIDWLELCREALVKRFGELPAATQAEKEKRYRFLGQRGFDGEDIRAAIR